MARTVTYAVVSGGLIITALNTKGKPLYKWRDRMMRKAEEQAKFFAPVNKVSNALHRGGKVRTYRDSIGWDRRGSNQHKVRGRLFATADHAYYVENGRGSNRVVVRTDHGVRGGMWYSWVELPKVTGIPGEYGPQWFFGSSGYEGHHTLEGAFLFISTQRSINASARRVG